jgi:iron-sulfur cluster repair protein YtfE (RIC family)
MAALDLNDSVPDWLIDHPQLLSMFKDLEIDYCCGGKSLRTACIERKLSAQEIYDRIEQLIGQDET